MRRVQGYTRKGAVQFFMKEYDRAIKTYEEGLKHDPENDELKEGIKKAKDELKELKRRRQVTGRQNREIAAALSDLDEQVAAEGEVEVIEARLRALQDAYNPAMRAAAKLILNSI